MGKPRRRRVTIGLLGLCLACVCGLGWAKPQRVVSINLCADQLALLLAAPRQLLSVSPFAHKPEASVLWREARAYPANRALAEEVFLLDPDLILAGAYTARATVQMLQRLGRNVQILHPATSMQDMIDNLLWMGRLLGAEARAQTLAEQMRARLAALNQSPSPVQVAGYGANNYTGGQNSLEQSLTEAAGLVHYGSERGLQLGGELALEQLIVDPPDVLMLASRFSQRPGRAYETLSHPALLRQFPAHKRFAQSSPHWVCGGPFALDEIERLAHFARDALP